MEAVRGYFQGADMKGLVTALVGQKLLCLVQMLGPASVLVLNFGQANFG